MIETTTPTAAAIMLSLNNNYNKKSKLATKEEGRDNGSGGALFPDGFAHMFELALFMLDLKWHHDIIEAVHTLEDQAAQLDSKLDIATRQLLRLRQRRRSSSSHHRRHPALSSSSSVVADHRRNYVYI